MTHWGLRNRGVVWVQCFKFPAGSAGGCRSFLCGCGMEAFAVALSDVRLREEDVPGASLGKHADGRVRKPHELCVPELKRWSACRGARRSGNKADLVQRLVMFAIFSYWISAMDVSRQRYTRSVISVTADVRLSSCFRRVSTYIAEGRDDEIVDPDHGANVSAKVEKLQKMGGTSVHPNLARVPKCPGADDPGWTSNLCKLPFFTFRTLYRHFVERSERGGWWRVWARRWKWFGSGSHDGRQWCVRWAAASTPKIQVIQRTGQRLSILQGWSCAEDSTFTRAPFRKRWRSCVCYLHRASVYEEGSPLRCESLLHGAG